MIEMSGEGGVVVGGEGEAPPLPASAFRLYALDAIPAKLRAVFDPLSPDSPRLAGADPEVLAAAEALHPSLLEAASYLHAFRKRYVREGARNERAPEDFHSHVRRYTATLALIRARAGRVAAAHGRPARVLDAGGPGVVSGALRADENVELSSTVGDLRRRFLTGPHREYDLVVCSEVLEHVTDPEVGLRGDTRLDYNAEVASTGARNMLTRLAEVLAPHGELLITTPNSLSLYALRELGHRRPAMIYRPHWHEYTPGEVAGLLGETGLDATLTTFEAYAFHDHAPEIDYLERVAAEDARRFWGDTTIAIAWRAGHEGETPGAAAYLEALVRAFAREQFVSRVGIDALVADRLR